MTQTEIIVHFFDCNYWFHFLIEFAQTKYFPVNLMRKIAKSFLLKSRDLDFIIWIEFEKRCGKLPFYQFSPSGKPIPRRVLCDDSWTQIIAIVKDTKDQG